MTPATALHLAFADGEYAFDLKLPQLAELQEKRGAGVFAIYSRVLKGRYLIGDVAIGATDQAEAYAEDIFETVRLGLIGGGQGLVDGSEVRVTALVAKSLIERYVYPAPLKESWSLAAAILGARIEGYTPPKKAEPAEKPATPKKTATRTRRSTSAKSSPTAPSSASIGSV